MEVHNKTAQFMAP